MTLIIIPARLDSKRLPRKPVQMIGIKSVIQRCIDRCREAGREPILATDSDEISRLADCRIVMTPEMPSGSDRVAWAAQKIDPGKKHEIVVNQQGDMPFIDPVELNYFFAECERASTDITTAYCDQSVVTSSGSFERKRLRCHIGLYGFHRAVLDRFTAMPQSRAELEQGLEQLRAPDEFTWRHVEFASMPLEINTAADLDHARLILKCA